MDATPIDQRLVRGLAGTLSLDPVDQEGQAVTLTGPVTVEVFDHAGGPALLDGDASEPGEDATAWTFDVPATATADLDRWTVQWTDTDTGSVRSTTVEVVGGHLFTVADARGTDPVLANKPAADIIAKRLIVEAEAEWICDVAFTPRLRFVTVDGNDTRLLALGVNACRRIVSVTSNGVDLSTGAVVEDDGTLYRPDGWPKGTGNIDTVVEAGLDAPPPDLRDAMVLRCKTLLLRPDSQIPIRALQEVQTSGATFKLDRASRFRTGIPDVDAVYSRYSRRAQSNGDTPGPASGSIDFDPGTPTLFHGRMY